MPDENNGGLRMKQSGKAIVILSFILVFVVLSEPAEALSLGAAPGVMEIGELKRGKEYAVDFYLLTNSKSEMVVGFGTNEAKNSMYARNRTSRYTFIPALASQEDFLDWIEFIRKRVVVSDQDSFKVRFPDGSIVNANEKVSFIIDVPQDAEPGYHAFEVVLKPKIGGGSGMGLSTIGVTRPVFIFKVPGEAERKGVIEGVAASRNGNRVSLDVLFRNTGTVTVSARISSLKIYNETGHYITTVKGGSVLVPPKSTKILRVYWTDEDMTRQKKIKVEATADYLTGRITKETMVTVPKAEVMTGQITGKKEGFPWWMIILALGVVMLFLYWRRR